MGIDILLTGFALFAAGYATYFAWRAGQSAEKAAHSEHRLAIMRGQVRGLEVSLVALDESHKKLQGLVHADRYWRGKREEQPELQPTNPDDVCPNWGQAQRDGPGSQASMCSCEYCNAKREDRRQRRASLRSGVKS